MYIPYVLPGYRLKWILDELVPVYWGNWLYVKCSPYIYKLVTCSILNIYCYYLSICYLKDYNI